ncbi:MAG: hypothetical protein CFE24_09600 [Flavobacterium sp. BFFFF2]|nr:MAG: hypothetical protein CFE24_09600 [Flavobacterium sp. BFFFF2]
MKKNKHLLTQLLLICWVTFSAFMASAQTTLAVGDIAFTGYSSTTTTDEFSFVILRTGGIEAGTTITFTDIAWYSGACGSNGWATNLNALTSGTIINCVTGTETEITWTAGTALSYGAQVKIAGTTATNGTVSGTALNLSSSGDQIFAIQGSRTGTHTMITAIHANKNTGIPSLSNASGWDNIDTANFTNCNDNWSNKPTCLTTGTNCIWMLLSFGNEIDNGRLKLSICLTGNRNTDLAAINDYLNWETQNTTAYTLGTAIGTCDTTPTIATTGTLNAFSACAGTASAQQSFTVSGSYLTANIVVTPPTGFEVSTTSGSGFTSSVTLTQSGGSVASTRVYVRLTSSASGAPSGNISCASTGVTTKNVAANGTVNPIITPTFTAVAPITAGGSLSALPTTSNNAIAGAWSPALNNATTTTYTFTPNGGQCGTITTLTITVNPFVAPALPIFSYVTPQTYTAGTAITPLLPTSSGGAVPTGGSTNATGPAASFNNPTGITVDASGNVYVAETPNHVIRKISSAGVVSIFAGSGTPGSANGQGTAASFYNPHGLAVDAAGNVYVADSSNAKIRKITPEGLVSDFAGSGTAGTADGIGTAASFGGVIAVAVDASGNVYVSDSSNHLVRKITSGGVVTTLANLVADASDPSTSNTAGIAVDASGNVYVAEFNSNIIRKITPGGVVTTLAGSATQGSANGTGIAASFSGPLGLAVDSFGNVYAADLGNHKIRKITPEGVVSDSAGSGTGSVASLWSPTGVAVDASGKVCVADYHTSNITLKIIPLGYNVSPALPAGLKFDPTTGAISGTPTADSPATDYTITATNETGSSTAVIRIGVGVVNVTPTFAAVAPICAGESLEALPTTSGNGIIGTWSPALNNLATTIYTFTPTAGQNAITTTLTITVNEATTPIFTEVFPICVGGSPLLPTTSNNSIAGTWSPAIDNTQTTTYFFTPNSGQCATVTSMTIVVNNATTPTFTQVSAICSGASLSALPTTSNNSITGTWSPVIDNMATTTYTFTPDGGQCASLTNMTITVNAGTMPSFTQVAPICSGASLTALPTTSNNSIAGTWSPAINNAATTTYTFTPNSGQCASATTMTISVNEKPTMFSGTFYITNGTQIQNIFGYDNIYLVYNTETAPSYLPISASLSSATYYVSKNLGGCESVRMPIVIITHIAPTITSPSCGSRLNAITAPITATAVANATNYLFEVTGNGSTRTYYSATNSFNFTQLPGSTAYNTAYSVRVAAGFNGQYAAFGAACSLTTPAVANTTQVISSMCGTILASMTTPIYCGQIVGASAYRFEFTTGGVSKNIDSTTNSVQINNLTGGAAFGTAYSVRVAAQVGGSWQAFGTACTVTTPAASTQIRTNQCGVTLANKWSILYCSAVTGATAYRFEWSNGGTVLTFNSTTSNMQLGNYTGWALSTTYSVRVAVQFGGSWQAYGSACSVKTPATMARGISEETVSFTVKAIPNPFETEYVLMAQGCNQTPIQVAVYDMLGKQVEQFNVEASELENRSLGTNYSSGIYNVMISQGDDQQVIRIIKK